MTNDARVFSNNPKKNQAIFIKEQGRNYSIFFGRGVLPMPKSGTNFLYVTTGEKRVVLPV